MSQDEMCDCCDNTICGQEMTCDRCNEVYGCQTHIGTCNYDGCSHKYENLCSDCAEVDDETGDAICKDCILAKELKQQATRIAKANEEAKDVLIKAGNKTPSNIQILKQRKLMGL
jgi:hypothetical protein